MYVTEREKPLRKARVLGDSNTVTFRRGGTMEAAKASEVARGLGGRQVRGNRAPRGFKEVKIP